MSLKVISAQHKKFALVVARFLMAFVVESLVDGAVDAIRASWRGLMSKSSTLVRVPCAYRLPIAAQGSRKLNKYDALFALGRYPRASTTPFDFVQVNVIKACFQVSLS